MKIIIEYLEHHLDKFERALAHEYFKKNGANHTACWFVAKSQYNSDEKEIVVEAYIVMAQVKKKKKDFIQYKLGSFSCYTVGKSSTEDGCLTKIIDTLKSYENLDKEKN